MISFSNSNFGLAQQKEVTGPKKKKEPSEALDQTAMSAGLGVMQILGSRRYSWLSVSLVVEPVEKVRWQKLQEKWPPYLPFKRRSRIEKPFWYP